jgi:hypothetical protein
MRRFTALPFLLLVTCAVAAIQKVPNNEPIATVEIPDKWQIKQTGEVIKACSVDGTLHFLITPAEQKVAETMGEAMRYIRNTGSIFVRPETRKNEPGNINGMDVQHITWLGKDKSGDMKIRFTVFLLSNDKRLLAAYWGSPASEKKYQADLKKMLESIKKA